MAGLGYPDATNTLRLSFGKVSATSDTLAELLEYKLPMNWQAATARLQKRMPLSLAASVDGTFGFSGKSSRGPGGPGGKPGRHRLGYRGRLGTRL